MGGGFSEGLSHGEPHPAHRGVVRVGTDRYFFRVVGTHCVKGIPMLYDTGAAHFYLNFNSARYLLGDNFLLVNQANVQILHSADSYGRIVTEYKFPAVDLEVENPLGGVVQIQAEPVVSTSGENLFGVRAIAQLPFTVEFLPVSDVDQPFTKGNIPDRWISRLQTLD